MGEVVFGETHATKGISDDVVRPLDVRQLRTELFDQKSPPHDPLSVELFEGEVLVVSKDLHLMSEKDVLVLLESFHDAEEFSLSGGVPSLCWVQLLTVEGYGFPIWEITAPNW